MGIIACNNFGNSEVCQNWQLLTSLMARMFELLLPVFMHKVLCLTIFLHCLTSPFSSSFIEQTIKNESPLASQFYLEMRLGNWEIGIFRLASHMNHLCTLKSKREMKTFCHAHGESSPPSFYFFSTEQTIVIK